MELTQEEKKAYRDVGEALADVVLAVIRPTQQRDPEKYTKEMGRVFAHGFDTPTHLISGRTTPRRMSNCPYCHAGIDTEAQGVRYYECGTRVVADPNVRYVKGCGK